MIGFTENCRKYIEAETNLQLDVNGSTVHYSCATVASNDLATLAVTFDNIGTRLCGFSAPKKTQDPGRQSFETARLKKVQAVTAPPALQKTSARGLRRH